ncbi:MAG: hypothetical protein NXI35_12635 [bacterium]|nr:hypothetical protein [bacterium]
MGKARCIGLGLLGVAFGAGLACESSENGDGSSGGFCPSLEGYVSPCDEPTTCARALARDCGALETILQPEIADEIASCMSALGQPMDCIDRATDLSTSSSIVEDFATAFCLECGDGSTACEEELLSGDDETPNARAGRVARVLTRDALERLQDECTTGDECAAGFEDCAKQFLARDLPSETAACLVDGVYDDYDEDCGSTSNASGDTDTSDSTSPSDPTLDPTGETDADPTGETEGDTEDVCNQVGCACQFNEDCAGALLCPMGTCEEPAQCGDDPYEPNNGEVQAFLLDPITDDDDQGSMFSAELEAATDIDWFRYEGSDTAFAIVGPYAQVNVNALELCIYAECLNGLENTDVTCNEGTTQQPSPNGRPGCCGTDSGGFEINLSCGGVISDESALVFMSVAGSEPGVCQEYTVTYNF